MDNSQIFASEKYMNAQNAPYNKELTISEEKIEEMQDKTQKPVIYFEEIEKGLVINKTKDEQLSEALGKGSWVGAVITLVKGKTQMQGRTVDAIFISTVTPATDDEPAPTQKKTVKRN